MTTDPYAAIAASRRDSLTPDLDHPYTRACGCPHCWVESIEADLLRDALNDIGAHIAWDVSLPRSVPKGDPTKEWATIDDLPDRAWAVHWLLSYQGPSTDDELAIVYGDYTVLTQQSESSIRSRRAELVRAGMVQATDLRRPTRNGSSATVWEVTAKGLGEATPRSVA